MRETAGRVEALREPIERLMARLEAQQGWLRAFQCPWRARGALPCQQVGELLEPLVESPLGPVPCPIHAREGCDRHVEYHHRLELAAEAAWAEAARAIGIPELFWPASFRAPLRPAALADTEAWLGHEARQGRALGLLGDNGLGKTFAACAALREWPGTKWFVYAPDLARWVLNPQQSDGTLERATTVGLLVIDNLGAEWIKPDGALVSKFDSIIWHREANRRPLIVTSRLPWEAAKGETFKGRLTLDMRDRIEAWMVMFQYRGESLRKQRGGTE